jgi:Tol biopolymer transport system component
MKRFFWFILLLFLVACNFSSEKTPAPASEVDTVDTAVAQKLTAVAQAAMPASTETVIPTPLASVADLKVVYVKSGDLWLWDGATSRQLTQSGRDSKPKISDDGQVIAFSRAGALWAVNADGSNERVLASLDNLAQLPHSVTGRQEVSNFEFAPASHTVYFSTIITGEGFPELQFDLARIDANGPSLQLLLKNGDGGEVTFSPDGSKIALVQPEKINLVNADGSGFETLFTFELVSTYSEWFYLPEIVWMPDSSGFKTLIPAHDPLANPKELTRFYFIPASGAKAAQLAEFLASSAFQSGAYISPDGSKVVYTKPQNGNLELHVIDASTADQLLFSLPGDKLGALGWTPDSQNVVYWRDDTRITWLLTPDGQSASLSDVKYASQVTWVDASRYLFVNESELRLRTLGQPSLLIDADLSGGFDFVLLK